MPVSPPQAVLGTVPLLSAMTVEPNLFPLMSEMLPLTAQLGQLQLDQETQFYPSNHFLVPTPKAIFKSSPHHSHSPYHHNHSPYHHSQIYRHHSQIFYQHYPKQIHPYP
jgi:hypothetical protein